MAAILPAMRAALLATLLLAALVDVVAAHDSWISRGALRNAAGEWCCGEGDCFVIPGQRVSHVAGGYSIWPESGHVASGSQENPSEFVPEAEAQPSPDGQFWRCKRPDGSRRCFFAPPEGY